MTALTTPRPQAIQLVERVQFPPGTHIFREGTRGRRAFIVESGLVAIWIGPDTQSIELERLGPQCIFGELALILDDQPRTASATAVAQTTCVVVKDYEFKQKLESSDPFVRALVRILAGNVRATTRFAVNRAEPRFDPR